MALASLKNMAALEYPFEQSHISPARAPTLVIACGALGRELTALRAANGHIFDVVCLPAILHNRPEQIPGAVRQKIRSARGRYRQILCAYGDCGTGGLLDQILKEEAVSRLPGAHCYSFFAGEAHFATLMDEEIGSFFLTDYLARHFERLVWQGLGLDRHPELLTTYFLHYRRLVHLVQTPDPVLDKKAVEAAQRLKLPLVRLETGYGALNAFVPSKDRLQNHG